MGLRVAEHPAAAVHVQDHGERPEDVPGTDDPDAHVADVGRHGHPVLVDRRRVDGSGLHVVEDGARLLG